MARIRSIHPGQWTDEQFVSVSPFARLLALALRNEADDQGVFEWKPVGLKMRLLPADTVDIVALLSELVGADIIRKYAAEGREYGAIRNFQRYQRPKKPNSLHPIPVELRTYLNSSAASSEPVENQSGNRRADVGGRMEDGGGSKTPPQPTASVGCDAPPLATPPPPVAAPVVAKPPQEVRGSRLPSDWTLPEDWREWATTELLPQGGGLPAIIGYVERAAERFRDHWLGKAGKDGAKRDWLATWRNWVREDIDRGKAPKGATNGKADAAGPGSSPDYVARVLERQRARFGSGGSGSPGADAAAVLPAASGGQ